MPFSLGSATKTHSHYYSTARSYSHMKTSTLRLKLRNADDPTSYDTVPISPPFWAGKVFESRHLAPRRSLKHYPETQMGENRNECMRKDRVDKDIITSASVVASKHCRISNTPPCYGMISASMRCDAMFWSENVVFAPTTNHLARHMGHATTSLLLLPLQATDSSLVGICDVSYAWDGELGSCWRISRCFMCVGLADLRCVYRIAPQAWWI